MQTKTFGIITGIVGLLLPSIICISQGSSTFFGFTWEVTTIAVLGSFYLFSSVTVKRTFLGHETTEGVRSLQFLDPNYYFDPGAVSFPSGNINSPDVYNYILGQSFFNSNWPNSNLSEAGLLLIISYVLIIAGLALTLLSNEDNFLSGWIYIAGGIVQFCAILFFFMNGLEDMSQYSYSANNFLPIPLAGIVLVILGFLMTKNKT